MQFVKGTELAPPMAIEITESAVQARMDGWLTFRFKNERDKLKFLLNHERKIVAVRNLCQELRRLELQFFFKNGRRMKVQAIAYLIDSLTNKWSQVALKKHAEDNLSESEKIRLITKFDQEQELERTIKNSIKERTYVQEIPTSDDGPETGPAA